MLLTLNLGHSRPTSSDTTTGRSTAPRGKARENKRTQEGCKAKPEERGHSLRFVTLLAPIMCSVDDVVSRGVALHIQSAIDSI